MTFEECKDVIDLYAISDTPLEFVRNLMLMVNAPVVPKNVKNNTEPKEEVKKDGKHYTERTLTCKRCGKEFTVIGPGNHHYCPECKKIGEDIAKTAKELAESSKFDDVCTPTGYPA